MLYYQLFQIGIILCCILFFFLPPLNAVLILILYFVSYQYYMTWRRAHKKEKHEGERHIDSHTLREKDYREDKIWSFMRYEELPLNEPIPITLELTPEFKEAQCFLLERERQITVELEPETDDTTEESPKVSESQTETEVIDQEVSEQKDVPELTATIPSEKQPELSEKNEEKQTATPAPDK